MTHRHLYKLVNKDDYFKTCSCGKKRKAVSITKERTRLHRKAENLWKQYAHMRDGEICQIRKYFPELNLVHSPILQVDHFFPRADKNLFYDTSNSTVICATCNYLKSNGSRQSTIINMAVKEIVLRREGQEKFDSMFSINDRREPNLFFHKPFYLETVIKDIEEKISFLKEPV